MGATCTKALGAGPGARRDEEADAKSHGVGWGLRYQNPEFVLKLGQTGAMMVEPAGERVRAAC